nr:hypothetical protein [Tanacetum cinerariifolium]
MLPHLHSNSHVFQKYSDNTISYSFERNNISSSRRYFRFYETQLKTDGTSDVFSRYSDLWARNVRSWCPPNLPPVVYSSRRAGTSALSQRKRARQNTDPRPPTGQEAAFSEGAHVNSLGNTQAMAMHSQPTNSASSIPEDSRRVGTSASSQHKRARQNTDPRLPGCQEAAFSEGCSICSSTDSRCIGTSASSQRKRTHENAQARSAVAEGPSSKRQD